MVPSANQAKEKMIRDEDEIVNKIFHALCDQ